MGVGLRPGDRGGDHTVDRSDGTSAACYCGDRVCEAVDGGDLDDLVSSEEDSMDQGEEGRPGSVARAD